MNIPLPRRVFDWLKKHPFILFVFIHAILFLAISAHLDNSVGNNSYEFGFAMQVLKGRLPFADFASEYPPFALYSFLPPALISSHAAVYGFLFSVQLFLYDVVILWILVKLTEQLRLKCIWVLVVYTLCLISLGVMVTGRFDLLPTMLTMAAIYAFIRGKNKTAWVFLALGVSVKIYPIAIAPLFALYLLRQGKLRQLIEGIIAFGVVVLAINLPFYIISPYGFMDFIRYHTSRGLHSESVYGSVLLLGKIMKLTNVDASLTFGSWNLISPLADTLAKLSFYVTGVCLSIAYALYARFLWTNPGKNEGNVLSDHQTHRLLSFSLLAVLIVLVTSKVLSPQFLIWLFPLGALVVTQRFNRIWWLFLVAGVLSQWIYPYHYLQFEAVDPYLAVMLFVRNLVLVGFTIALFFPIGATRLKPEQNAIKDSG